MIVPVLPKKKARGLIIPKKKKELPKRKKEPSYEETLHMQEVERQVIAGADLSIHSLASMLSKLTDLKMKVFDKAARGVLLKDLIQSDKLLSENISGIKGWLDTLEA